MKGRGRRFRVRFLHDRTDLGPRTDAPPPAGPWSVWFARSRLAKRYNIDAKRVYVMGLSMGGYGTWDAVQRYPGRFAAAVPICGGGDAQGAKVMKNTPIWAFHGN